MRPVALAAALACLGALTLAGCATKDKRPPGDDAPTLATLAKRSVEIPQDSGVASDEAQAMAAYRAFLEVARAAPQRPEVMRRLADLEMDLADRKSSDGGATPDYKAAVAQYEKVLKEHPNAPGNDRVLYQIARAQEQGGDLEGALKTLSRIAKDYPDTMHADEVHFRRGELLFATRDYVGAGEAYATVLKSSQLTPFTERALYMRGWSLFKQAKLEQALEPFFKVLDLKLGSRPSPGPDPLSHLTRADRELLEDTHRVMSLSLANLEGAATIGKFVTSQDAADVRRAYEHRVYVELAELYLKQDRPKDAADTLAFYARLRPLATPAPELLARVIEIHESKGFPTLALDAKRDFVSRYGRTSEFRKANAEGWAAAQPRVKTHLVELARHHHAATQQTKSRTDLQEAVRWYRELLTAFPDDGEVVPQRFLLAELLFEDRQFAAAVDEYETVAYGAPVAAAGSARAAAKPPAFAKAADAGYSALLAYAEQAKAAAAPAAKAPLQRAGIASALRFADTFPADPRVGSVTTTAAETLLALGEAERASGVARQALGGPASAAEQRTAWTVIAVSAFDRGQLAEAEQAFGQAIERAGSGTPQANDLAERRAMAIYKQGDAARSAGRMREAIEHFDRLAGLAPQSSMRAAAQFDVATALIGLKDWSAATSSLEDFRRRYPTHALQADVPAKLALAYTEQKRWAAAAGEYDRIAAGAGDPALRRSAQWQVAELHERAMTEAGGSGLATVSRKTAITAYERYLAAWPQPLEAATEARWKLVQLTRADGQAAKSLAWTRALRALELAGGAARTPRSKALSSLAAIELTQPLREAYEKVKLVEPLAANLKLKKARMEALMKAYADASADGAAEAVTAATYHTAALYQDFGKAMLGSQRPRNLKKKVEIEQYNVLLEEQAFPFEEKAIQLHETNARRTTQGLYDEWVRKSLAALATLKPARWAKSERSEGALDAIR
ncbi:MAG: tetratricopeptide repeat protein [Burkholderiales bacterium]|nr:tetratricopeptide repeat protein [Burkholderiales bacterium]